MSLVSPQIGRHKSSRIRRDVTTRNAITRCAYQGINTLIVWLRAQKLGFASLRRCTHRQAKQAGGQVRKGEQGCRVIFYKTVCLAQTDANGETESVSVPMRRTFVVFNTDQIDGLAEKHEADERPEFERWAMSKRMCRRAARR